MTLLPERAVIDVDGEEVVMRLVGLPTRRFIELWPVVMGEPTIDNLAAYAALVDEFRESWTLPHESAMDAPWQLNLAVCRAWLREVGRAPVPLASRRSEPGTSDALD